MFSNSRPAFLALVVGALILATAECRAESKPKSVPSNKSLFRGPTEQPLDERRRSLRLSDVDLTQVLEGEVHDGTSDDTLVDNAPKESTLLLLRSEFQTQALQDNPTWAAYEDSGRLETIAERTTMAQGVTELTSYVLASPFGTDLRQLLNRAARIKDAVSMRMSRQSDGSLGFESGQRGGHFLRFTVSGSARRGIEPRLELGRSLMLKYDIFEGAPLLEYDVSF